MQSADFGRLLAENRWQVDASRLPSAMVLVLATGMPSVVNRIQKFWYGKRVERTPLVSDPIFVIGHWRTGTTYAHELLALDPHFASPTTFQCFMPRGFLVSKRWLCPLTARLLPRKRPMDNMDMGWEVPQEDEFALLSMGLPTPYRRMAFPNHSPRHLDYINLQGVSRSERKQWKQCLYGFIKNLNYYYRRPIVLKSPPHTGRISTLLEIFPNAKFIHITRSPLEFIPSTIHMWASLDAANGFQLPHHRHLESYVFDCYEMLYQGFARDRHLLHAGNHQFVRFEDLVTHPVDTMRRIYDQLNLGDFSRVAQRLREREVADRNYRRNRHELLPAMRRKIERICSSYLGEFGYGHDVAAA